MVVLLSPTKNMREEVNYTGPLALPQFKEETSNLVMVMRQFNKETIQKLMKINDKLAGITEERFKNFKLDQHGTPAILTYDGLQFRNIEADSFTQEDIMFAENQVRIISGLYGVLTPYTSIYLYRLELQTKLPIGENKDLYGYWRDLLFKQLSEKDTIFVNLASKEYSKVIEPYLDDTVHMITCIFKVKKGDCLKVESTAAKIARGKMCRYIVKNKITSVDQLKQFKEEEYQFRADLSTEVEFVFVKNKNED